MKAGKPVRVMSKQKVVAVERGVDRLKCSLRLTQPYLVMG